MRIMSYDVQVRSLSAFIVRSLILYLFFVSFIGFGQHTPKVSSKVDTTFIKIGEQLQFKIEVEADSIDTVIFPEGQTFSPLEMVEAFVTDTTRKNDRVTLQKTYALTQFDSGSYKLPPQRIEINGIGYLTDSLRINVATVPVDTIAQKMYDIKPLIQVEKSNSNVWKMVLVILVILALIAGIVYWFVLRKKPLTEKEKEALLPPYDRAILELKKLDNSKYLIQDEYKQYYSELTDIVRSYLEEDANISALESTTDELITKLELMKDAGELELDNDTIKQFKNILQTADLVKFAKSKPPTSVAHQDRKTVEHIVVKTRDAIPEPTLEELMAQEEYLEELEAKKRKKKIVVASVLGAALILISGISAMAYYGFEYSKDTILGHPTKKLLEGEWVASSYGYPPLSLETPNVLKRIEDDLISNMVNMDTVRGENRKDAGKDAFKKFTKSKDLGITEFLLEEGGDDFYLKFEDLSIPGKETELEKEAEESIEMFAKEDRVKNIITKQDKYTTPEGSEGLKQFGTLSFKNSKGEFDKKNYIILNFATTGNFKRLFLIWNVDDEYADKIVDRILTSIEIKSEL